MVLPILLAIVTSAITSLGFLAMVLRTTELNYKIWAEVASMRRFLDRAEGLLARMLLEPPPPAALLLDPAPPPVPTDLPKWIRWMHLKLSRTTIANRNTELSPDKRR